MKNIITINEVKQVLFALSCSILLLSCSKWDDFKDYTNEGEIKYTGKVDSVKILPGKERVMFKGILSADPKVVKYKIFWNDYKDSVEFDIDGGSSNLPVEEIFSVDEGVKNFVIYTYDAQGNSSVPVNAVGTSYGSSYRRKLNNRLISSFKYTLDYTNINWEVTDPSLGAQYTEVEYTTGGETILINTPVSVDSTMLDGITSSITIRYRTIFKPAPNSIDTFAIPFEEHIVPGQPVIVGMAPLSGPIGETVKISGANFGEDPSKVTVKVDGVNATVVSVSDGEIAFEVPETSSGFVELKFGPFTYKLDYFHIPVEEDYTKFVTHLLFDGNGDDASNVDPPTSSDNPATLVGSATYGPGLVEQGLALNGSGHATLPVGFISGLESMTVSCWVKLNSLANWQRVWDFGTGTSTNTFFTVQAQDTGKPRFAVKKDDGAEQRINSSGDALQAGKWYHIAVTYSGINNLGILYINGVEVGRNDNMTIKPSDLGVTNQNYIGKAQWPDPLLNGTVDDFRIYNTALTAEEVGKL